MADADESTLSPRQIEAHLRLEGQLLFALQNYPERVALAPVEDLAIDYARANGRRPANVRIEVDDEDVKALKGSRELRRSRLVLVRLPVDVQDRADSPIVLPGEKR